MNLIKTNEYHYKYLMFVVTWAPTTIERSLADARWLQPTTNLYFLT